MEDTSQTIVIANRKGHTNVGDPEAQKVVEEFRLFYLDARKSGRADLMQIFRDFRKSKEFDGVWFNPYPNQVKGYLRKWEKSLPFHIKRVPIKGADTKKMPERTQLMKEVAYHDLEAGSKSLQALLVEDAQKLIEQSNETYAGIDEAGGMWTKTDWAKIQLAKKKLALAISEKVLSGAHKYQLIALKKNSENRQNAGFLMDLIRRSAAGDVSDAEMDVLETAVLQ